MRLRIVLEDELPREVFFDRTGQSLTWTWPDFPAFPERAVFDPILSAIAVSAEAPVSETPVSETPVDDERLRPLDDPDKPDEPDQPEKPLTRDELQKKYWEQLLTTSGPSDGDANSDNDGPGGDCSGGDCGGDGGDGGGGGAGASFPHYAFADEIESMPASGHDQQHQTDFVNATPDWLLIG